ncbi:hypothetical protein ACFLZB_04910, partial [Nanoarchaeota archaeon]
MKIAIIGKSKLNLDHIKKDIAEAGFEFTEKSPDWVISFGGDGTLLATERTFPNIPKLPLKDSLTCQKCHDCSFAHALDLLKNKKYQTEELIKLECSVGDQKLICMNDIVVRNDVPTHALRFSVEVNDKKYKDLIGDGIVVATPFGSTGYHESITRNSFEKGMGIAFNNLTKPLKHLVVDDNSIIKVKINRRTGFLVADNNKDFI